MTRYTITRKDEQELFRINTVPIGLVFEWLIRTAAISFALYMFPINPGFFGTIIVVVVLWTLVRYRPVFVITDKGLHFVQQRWISPLSSVSVLNYADIENVYINEDGHAELKQLQDLILDTDIHQYDYIKVHLKDGTTKRIPCFANKVAFQEAAEIIREQLVPIQVGVQDKDSA